MTFPSGIPRGLSATSPVRRGALSGCIVIVLLLASVGPAAAQAGPRGSAVVVDDMGDEPCEPVPDAPDLRRLTTSDLARVVAPPEALGEHWERYFEEHEEPVSCGEAPAILVLFRNLVDFPTDPLQGRVVGILLQVMADLSLADAAILVQQETVGYSRLGPEEALGDGPALRRVVGGGAARSFPLVAYLFRVSTAVVGVTVTESGAETEDLHTDARQFAMLQADRVRAALSSAPQEAVAQADMRGRGGK